MLDQAAEAVRTILAEGVQAAMNRFNGKGSNQRLEQALVVGDSN